jgi:hypothetical protein|tara:strand:- start:843 stop:1439 length:597 start_codon:yes stop_codon:yes gene_type:complete
MEIEKDLHNYIRVFQEALPEKIYNNFVKICKDHNSWEDASIVNDSLGSQAVKKQERDTKRWGLNNMGNKSLTEVHWANFLKAFFKDGINEYLDLCGYPEAKDGFRILDIQVLKYKEGGHYIFHIDHGMCTPRTFSCIYFVNDDYEGGDLIFKYPGSGEEKVIPKKKNTLIVWPSTFLYPHTVTPVTKGERFSVVSWAL